MREDGIGRVLVASLHQSIADTMPMRLGFYENWLNEERLRDGTIGLAPIYAVLSFLRQEGPAYHTVTRLAGEYAAEWTVDAMPRFRRSAVRLAPPWLRARLLTRVMNRLVRATYAGSRAVGRVRRGTTRIDVRVSIFCTVRERVPYRLCGYYAAAYARLLSLFDCPAEVEVVSCRGAGEGSCALTAVHWRTSGLSPDRGLHISPSATDDEATSGVHLRDVADVDEVTVR